MGNQAYNIAYYLKARGYNINVYTSSRNEYNDIEFDKEHADLNIHRYTSNTPLKNIFRTISYIIKNRNKNEVVFLSGTSPILLTLLIKLFCNWKIIAIIHGHEILMISSRMKNLFARALRSADNIVTVSDFAKNTILENINLNEKKITTISNGIPFNRFGNNITALKKEKKNGSLKLLTIGSLTPRKGQHNVVAALPVIQKEWPGSEYHMIGVPQEQENINRITKELGIQNRVHIHGMLNDDELYKVAQDADIFIMLSETAADGDVEGFGIAIIEANLLGIPAIGSKGCGIERAISDKYNGILVNPKDPYEVSNAVNEIVSNYSAYSANAIEWAKRHDWNILIEDYINVIMS